MQVGVLILELSDVKKMLRELLNRDDVTLVELDKVREKMRSVNDMVISFRSLNKFDIATEHLLSVMVAQNTLLSNTMEQMIDLRERYADEE